MTRNSKKPSKCAIIDPYKSSFIWPNGITFSIPMFCVYLLKSQTSELTYVGATKDPYNRVLQHNKGQGARFLRGKGPFFLVAFVSGFTRYEI